MGLGLPNFKEGTSGKIGTKLEKRSISQGFEGEFLPFVLEWQEPPPILLFWPQIPFSDNQIEPEN